MKTSHTMTMRNEIYAMANKNEPNDGVWFNTESNVVNADEYIVSNGINYGLGMGAVSPGQTAVNTASAEWTSLMGEFRPGASPPISPYNTN